MSLLASTLPMSQSHADTPHSDIHCSRKALKDCKSPFTCLFSSSLLELLPKIGKGINTEYDSETQGIDHPCFMSPAKDTCHGCHASGSQSWGVLWTLQTQQQGWSSPPACPSACSGPGVGHTEGAKPGPASREGLRLGGI